MKKWIGFLCIGLTAVCVASDFPTGKWSGTGFSPGGTIRWTAKLDFSPTSYLYSTLNTTAGDDFPSVTRLEVQKIAASKAYLLKKGKRVGKIICLKPTVDGPTCVAEWQEDSKCELEHEFHFVKNRLTAEITRRCKVPGETLLHTAGEGRETYEAVP